MFRRLIDWCSGVAQRVADRGAALVRPVERLVGGTAGKLLAATAQVERVESLFLRFFLLLSWPLRAVGRVLKAMLPHALARRLEATAATVRRSMGLAGMALLQMAETLNLDRGVLALVWMLQPIWRPLVALAEFGNCWLNTREYRRALPALPAIALAGLVFGVGAWHAVFGKSQTISNYKAAVRETLDAKDFDRAQLYERKLAQLGVDTKLSEYRTALALADEGQLDEAYRRMQLLAPLERPGYPAAHFWIVQQVMSGNLVEPGDAARLLAKSHLDHLATLEITGPYQQLLLAVWLSQGDQLDEAASVLEPLVAVLPNAAFERMRIDLALKRPEQARQDARALVTHMTSLARSGTELDADDYQWWLAAEELLGNVPQMRTLLDQWRALEPDNAQVRQTLATVCGRQALQLLREPLPNQQQIVALWLEAAELDNSSRSIAQLARTLYRDRQQSAVWQRVCTDLRQSQRTPASLLVALGTEAAMVQRYGDARLFFGAAVVRDDRDPIAWNNYGLVLGEGDDVDLDAALLAVNRSLEIAPTEHRFRETRGQILLKLQRWQEAVEDLEFALNGLPELAAIHLSLAVAYSALGQEELARLHRMRVE